MSFRTGATDCHVGALPLLAMTGNRSARLSFGAETDAHVIARSASDAAIRFSPAPGDVFLKKHEKPATFSCSRSSISVKRKTALTVTGAS